MGKTRKVVMTHRAPVQIDTDNWTVIASAYEYAGALECQARETWRITVRRHADGRTLIYGGHDTGPGGAPSATFRGALAGWLLPADAEALELAEHIISVAEAIGAPHLADECMADLPPVDLDAPGTVAR